jgi:hypothetical protein
VRGEAPDTPPTASSGSGGDRRRQMGEWKQRLWFTQSRSPRNDAGFVPIVKLLLARPTDMVELVCGQAQDFGRHL